MAMNNNLAEVHPELVSEWSEKNLPLILMELQESMHLRQGIWQMKRKQRHLIESSRIWRRKNFRDRFLKEIFGKLGLRICNSFADFSGKPSSDNDIQLMVYSIRE